MMTKKTITFTALFASIVMLTIVGTTQAVQAQILGSDLHNPGQSLLVIIIEDGSGSILPNVWTDTILAGEVAALNAFYGPGPNQQAAFDQAISFALIEFSTTPTQIGVGGTPGNTIFTVTDQASLDALTNAISNKVQSEGFTCLSCALLLANTIAGDNPHDVVIVDLATDGEPFPSTDPPGILDTPAMVIQAAFDINKDNGGNVDGLNALGVNLAQGGIDLLSVIPFPDPIVIDQVSRDSGFVIFIEDFTEFPAAFEQKLGVEICNVPEPPPECFDVGGEFLPIDSTALLIAGMSANLSMIVPIAAGIAGVGAYLIHSRMNKD